MNGELVIKAIYKIYPEIQGRFVYWSSKHDLTEWENPIDGLVWENTEYEKPTWDQIEQAIVLVELEDKKLIKIAQCQKYLNDTDWYIIRMLDPSNSSIVPDNILINRANARTFQKDINDVTTLDELNNININFN